MKRVIIITTIIMFSLCTTVIAHNKNIKGYNDKYSNEIIQIAEKYYGYHKENEIKHYHQVKWNEEKQQWNIINPAVYYDENFNIIDNLYNENTRKVEVEFYKKVDGDTAEFKLDGKVIKVRFLGINTPETVDKTTAEEPYGKEASMYTTERLEKANKIELEYDANAEEKDKYQRILAWVWVDENLLQKELVAQGLADTYMLQNNYRYAGVLQLAKEKAKDNKMGIWSNEITITDTENENIIIKNGKEINDDIVTFIVVIILIAVVIVARQLKKRNCLKM